MGVKAFATVGIYGSGLGLRVQALNLKLNTQNRNLSSGLNGFLVETLCSTGLLLRTGGNFLQKGNHIICYNITSANNRLEMLSCMGYNYPGTPKRIQKMEPHYRPLASPVQQWDQFWGASILWFIGRSGYCRGLSNYEYHLEVYFRYPMPYSCLESRTTRSMIV